MATYVASSPLTGPASRGTSRRAAVIAIAITITATIAARLRPGDNFIQPDVLIGRQTTEILLVRGKPVQKPPANVSVAVVRYAHDDVAHVVVAENRERLVVRKIVDGKGELEEIRGREVAVAVHQRLPVVHRTHHRPRVLMNVRRDIRE